MLNRLGKDTTVGRWNTNMLKFLRGSKLFSTIFAYVIYENFILRKLARHLKHEPVLCIKVGGVYLMPF